MEESSEDSVENSISATKHKIFFVGDTGVGKTAIIIRILDYPFEESYKMRSIGVDFMSKNIRYLGQNIKLQIWDTPGQEKYKGLIPSYVRNSSIVFIVYEISSKTSFNNVPNWIYFIKSIENTATIVLCGNKTDLTTREVQRSEGEQLAKREGITFFEVSAKTNDNIKLMFYTSVAGLPTFAEEATNKESLIKDLLEENGVENIQDGNNFFPQVKQEGNTMNVNGTVQNVRQKKKKGCGC